MLDKVRDKPKSGSDTDNRILQPGPIRAHHPTKFGDFRYRPLVDVFENRLDWMNPENVYRDLPLSASWIWGSLYDDADNIFVMTRDMAPLLANRFNLFDNRKREGCQLAPEALGAHSGQMELVDTDERINWVNTSARMTGVKTLEINIDKASRTFSWYEKDIVEVEGTVVPSAIQIWAPGPKPITGMAYVSQYMHVKGTIFGRPCDGWLGFDFLYLPPGQTYGTSIMGFRPDGSHGINVTWPSTAILYDDGSFECGYFGAGLDDWQFAVAHGPDGITLRGHVISTDFERKENGFPKKMWFRVWNDITGQEEGWEWNEVPGTDLVDIPRLFPEINTYWACEGVMRRSNEKRKVVRSLGWPDFYSDKRIELYRDILKQAGVKLPVRE